MTDELTGQDPALESFLTLSAALTGFAVADLQGTGVARLYLDTVRAEVGNEAVLQLLGAWDLCSAEASELARMGDAGAGARLLQDGILADDRFGPLARNIMKLWYLGVWNQMPGRDAHDDPSFDDPSFTVSEQAYVQGLIWPAMGAHTKGARQPGFGSWKFAPGTPRP